MKKLIILLHGVGSSGADLEGLGYFFQQVMPEVEFVSPDGSEAFDGGEEGYQWFSLAGITESSRTERVAAAREGFDTIISDILKEKEIVPDRDKVILLGFSQGSIMALDALVRDSLPLAGVVAFSGRLASAKPYHPSANASVLLVHGMADTVIPWAESEAAAAALVEAGVRDVETLFEPEVVHTISGDGIAKAMEFVTRHFELS